MFSWITGPRMTNAIEELEADVGYENTIVDPPETPAHQFAVKAFKHAIFGTPAPEDMAATRKLQKKQLPDTLKTKAPEMLPPKDTTAPSSPSKQPAGIMKTPVTANKTRKSVTFNAHVVDNEGKKEKGSKSGIPDDCPGKFPSPWTPGTELKTGLNSEQKPRTKLMEALHDARTTTQQKSGQKQKARDDSDITVDMGAPRSSSGKYWKEQYERYAEQSEKEVKKLVSKQQLAKNFAKKKDDEVVELVKRIEEERKRHRRREQELEQQNKDQREHLRQVMAENHSTSMEIMALKNRIKVLEKSSNSASQEGKTDIPVYEDGSKDPPTSQYEYDPQLEMSYLSTKSHPRGIGKENSPPKSRHTRRQTVPDARSATPFTANTRLGVGDGQVSTLIGKSPRPRRASHSTTKPSDTASTAKRSSEPFTSASNVNSTTEKATRGYDLASHSSPLPQPSPGPDLWLMDNDESNYGAHDKMAIPISIGSSHPNPTESRRLAARRQMPHAKVDRSKPALHSEKSLPTNVQPRHSQVDHKSNMPFTMNGRDRILESAEVRTETTNRANHHTEISSQALKNKDDQARDRKEQARQRLAERKKRKSTLV
ncbi:unnamed protein product [Periconia digitata]|uniref:Spindle pole body-associated protein cut12 domain-containing protein n=1 Tax=Periconia digitata TaxID=1303443 RepID=A0A9W4UDC4_9PLEO|nr:unnamed protein product [Periconia digitata]